MNEITLEKVESALERMEFDVRVPKEIMVKAKSSLDKMLMN